jgi:hypothetical protein
MILTLIGSHDLCSSTFHLYIALCTFIKSTRSCCAHYGGTFMFAVKKRMLKVYVDLSHFPCHYNDDDKTPLCVIIIIFILIRAADW